MQEQDSEPIAPPTISSNSHAGPSKPSAVSGDTQPDSDDEDDERPDVAALRALSKQIQKAPSSSGASGPKRVIIPRRGEKDFEPLDVTVNIQEKMLRESRQALFDGLQGVRGTSSKNMSHAYIPLNATYPKIIVNKGSLLTTMGQSVRCNIPSSPESLSPHDPLHKGKQKQVTDIELLPEEALYMVERGSMQIWVQYEDAVEMGESGRPEWNEEIEGIRGCVEMSTMEAFDRFIGLDALSLERYQAYAGLKRLGYTVYRTAEFLPTRFRKPIDSFVKSSRELSANNGLSLTDFRTLVGHGLRGLMGAMRLRIGGVLEAFIRLISGLGGKQRRRAGTLLGSWTGTSYGALYQKLRIIPRSHPGQTASIPVPKADPPSCAEDNIYAPLDVNPYLPFFHVWKPNTHWTRSKWDKGSPEGILAQPPAFYVGVVDARSTTFPTLDMLETIFEGLPHQEPPKFRPRPTTGPGSQVHAPPPAPGLLRRVWSTIAGTSTGARSTGPQVNTFAALKQGDRTLVTAVNDGGNIGWMRFGRGTFEDHDMVTLP